jgi:hypothetical protein
MSLESISEGSKFESDLVARSEGWVSGVPRDLEVDVLSRDGSGHYEPEVCEDSVNGSVLALRKAVGASCFRHVSSRNCGAGTNEVVLPAAAV